MALDFDTIGGDGIAGSHAMPKRWLSILGIGESGLDGLSAAAIQLLKQARLVVGGERHLRLAGPFRAETLAWKTPFRDTIPQILERRGEPVCVLASGDPFWFGAGAVLAESIAAEEMLVLPAPSTFSLAAAKMGWPLQSVATLGLHAARVESILRYLHDGQRILALSAGGDTPAITAELMTRHGFGSSIVHVLEAIGGPRERVVRKEAGEIVAEAFDPLNVMAIEVRGGEGARPIPFAGGLPDTYFEHDGQITKREVRAITLSSLRPAPGELLWDVGLGSGSVAIEWLLSHPAMRALGFEKSAERAERAARNAAALGVPTLDIREGEAPCALQNAPTPDAIFVGGGLADPHLLDMCWHALKPGGRMVCNAVTFEGEAALSAFRRSRGGSLTRISIERERAVGRYTAWQPAMPVVQWTAVKPWR
jgi:precorrin-6Y C5,15-methyltransferase (decarboxylating)